MFAVGKTYACKWPTDHTMTTPFTVVARTAQFLTLRRVGETKDVRCKVKQSDGSEWCLPFGSYSMAPVMRSTREVAV